MIQSALNGLAAGAGYALLAAGFAAIYAVGRFFHIAHAAVFTVGAYAVLLLTRIVGLPFWLGSVVGILTAAGVGLAIEFGVYRPVRRRGGSPLVLLVASLGAFVAIQEAIALGFGDRSRILRPVGAATTFSIAGIHLSLGQALSLIAIVTAGALVLLVLRYTRAGLIFRAVVTDAELAVAHGIDVRSISAWTMAVGSALAAVAAIVMAIDLDLRPRMGFHALVMAIAASIVGGVRSVSGAILGGILVGLIEHLAAWWLPTQWQTVVLMLLLIVVLLVRPGGLFGAPPAAVRV